MFKKSSGIMTEDSFRHIAMVSKAGLYDVSSSCYFLKVLHIDFYSGYGSLHSHQHYIRVPVSPHHFQHLSKTVSFAVFLTWVGWIQNTVNLIFLMIKEAEHVFRVFLFKMIYQPIEIINNDGFCYNNSKHQNPSSEDCVNHIGPVLIQ